MSYNKARFVHPADSRAAQSMMRTITTRIQQAKTEATKNGKSVEQVQKELLGRLKSSLQTFSKKNPSEATALLEQLKLKYPNFKWED
jgi:uncharacterized protein (UPF0305 family)